MSWGSVGDVTRVRYLLFAGLDDRTAKKVSPDRVMGRRRRRLIGTRPEVGAARKGRRSMTIFTSFGRRRATSAVVEHPDPGLPEEVRQALPPRFEAVGEALVLAADVTPACAVVGRDVARDGAALGEALDGLRTTFDLVAGAEPDVAAVEALSIAWSEATLEFLHGLSCEDPLTGLTSFAHLRTRLDEIYREVDQVGGVVSETHALVVLDMAASDLRRRTEHQLTRALHIVQVTRMARAVFAGGETIARLSPDRAVVVVRRVPELGASVAMLRELLADIDLGPTEVRVWIEGLPAGSRAATSLVDELSR
jgi:GGDEF domain-containing protein